MTNPMKSIISECMGTDYGKKKKGKRKKKKEEKEGEEPKEEGVHVPGLVGDLEDLAKEKSITYMLGIVQTALINLSTEYGDKDADPPGDPAIGKLAGQLGRFMQSARKVKIPK